MKKKIFYLSLLMLFSLSSCVVALSSTSTPSTPSTPNTDIPSTPIPPDPNPVPPSTDSPTLPPNELSSDINNILETRLSIDSTLRLVSSTGLPRSTRSSNVDYSASYLKTVFTDAKGSKKYSYVENTSGKVSNVYIDARDFNKVSRTTTDQNWEDQGWISQSFVSSDFRNESGNVYTYYGTSQRAILDSLTRMDLTDLFANGDPTLTLTVLSGKVQSLAAESNPDANNDKYVLNVTILDAPRTASLPDYNKTPDAGSVLNSISNYAASYSVVTTNNLSNETRTLRTTVNSNIIYAETETKNGTISSYERHGYFKTPQYGWSEYNVTEASNNTFVTEFTSNPVLTIPPMQLLGLEAGLNYGNSSYFFQWADSASQNTLIPSPYLENASDFIPFKLSSKEQILDYTIKMHVSNDKITSISYDVQSSDGTIGQETLLFSYGSPGQIKTVEKEIMDSIENQSSNTQFTWRLEKDMNPNSSTNAWDTLVGFLGEQNVLGIPYRYASPISGKWTATVANNNSHVTVTAPVPPASAGYSEGEWVNQYNRLLAQNNFARYGAEGDVTYNRKNGFDVEIGVRSSHFELVFRKIIP